jgi:hypothetical protein
VSYTPEEEEDVLRIYRANPRRFSPFKASRSTGISLPDVFEIIGKNQEDLAKTGERHDGFGRPDMRIHLVTRRRAMGEPWDNTDPKIAEARASFEAGTHLMATGRDGQWLLLYAIERTGKPEPKPRYFNLEKA